ncbi:hypothetical protein CW304_18850 [Bacillus sp. UFRGS-B20]|nr:hypothetical protein CW304_18850 [Bacillus sp. UFRGS-B20]
MCIAVFQELPFDIFPFGGLYGPRAFSYFSRWRTSALAISSESVTDEEHYNTHQDSKGFELHNGLFVNTSSSFWNMQLSIYKN